jgi:hypothetical protein
MAYLKYLEEEDISVSRGLVRNTSVRNIFGYATSVGGTFIPAWEENTTYTYPTSNLVMGLVSSDNDDQNLTVRVIGLDSNYEEVAENVTLTGNTEVFTTEGFFRINDAIITSGTANGNITVANTGTTYAFITAGEGKNQAAIFTVPANHSFYLYRLNAFAADASDGGTGRVAAFRNFVRNNGTGTEFRVGQTVFTDDLTITRAFPFKYDEKSDIQLQVRKLSGDNLIAGVFGEGLLINDEGTGQRS